MKFKPLEWESGRNDYSMKGILQRTKANIELRFKNGSYKIFRSYNVSRGATSETQDRWFLLILEDGNVIKHDEVASLEVGKIIAEHDCQNYLKEYYEEFQKFML